MHYITDAELILQYNNAILFLIPLSFICLSLFLITLWLIWEDCDKKEKEKNKHWKHISEYETENKTCKGEIGRISTKVKFSDPSFND